MDESFFLKYAIQIKKQKTKKEEIVSLLYESTGIQLSDDMFSIKQQNITFHISSVMKQSLYKKNIINILKEKGYNVTL